LTALRLPEAIGVPGDCESPLVFVDDDEVLVGAAEAPPDGLLDVVDVVDGAAADDDVDVVVDGVPADVVVEDEDDVEELFVAAADDVWVVPAEEVVDDEPPHPATTRMSVSAARARVSFEVMACLLPGQAKTADAVLGA
jgi:hypothetical protein